ncbi:MAG: HAD family phosphatase [candidate division KSB1 bacterium]|nr:HAD family phosphatase [candidate division KSB1 bacterium]
MIVPVKAVIFDFDGVVAETLSWHVQAWNIVLARHHIQLTDMDIAVEEGAGAQDIIRKILHQKSIDITEDSLQELVALKRRTYKDISKAFVYPETAAFIMDLKERGYRLALVTGSVPEAIRLVSGTGALTNFETIVTSLDVTHTKPDPEGFLLAARRLNISPKECLVIENAPNGVRAAKSAGMHCVALRTTIEDDSILSAADHIIDHVSDFKFDTKSRLIL